MAVRTVPFEVKNFNNLDEFLSMLELFLGYLEKANGKDLGNFTTEGKSANAGYNNYTVYWDWYKKLGYGNQQAQPYCAGFVSTTLAMAFGLDKAKALLCGDLFIYCPDGYNRFKAKSLIFSKPKRGDVVFFWSTSLGRWGHTGIVFDVDSNGKGYTTIEANTASGNDVVERNGGATCRKHYTFDSKKIAFGRPNYEAQGISLHKNVELPTYAVGTGADGLTITADKLNVRTEAGATSPSSIKRTIGAGEKFFPSLKVFIDGNPWIYDKNIGWISAKYVTGWIQEFTCDNKWWYVKKDYSCTTNAIDTISGNHYYFDAAGYMLTGSITFKTDENGVLKTSE